MLLPATCRQHPDLLITRARPVFLHGCGLPEAWAGQAQWRVLETGFGLGLNFLATWQAWRTDPQRSRMLHFVSTDTCPVSPAELLQAAGRDPDLLPLAAQVCQQWHGLLAGFHRMVFEGGNVLLTLGIGDIKALLKEQSFEADAVYLGDVNPTHNPDIRDPYTLKAIARCCRRGTRLVSMAVTTNAIDSLTQCGFDVAKAPAIAPQPEHLQASFNPHWKPRKAARSSQPVQRIPQRCVVISAGLAGAACAASLTYGAFSAAPFLSFSRCARSS